MSKIRKAVKFIPLWLAIVLLVTGCHVRLATKEDWVTAAPTKSAAATPANGEEAVLIFGEENTPTYSSETATPSHETQATQIPIAPTAAVMATPIASATAAPIAEPAITGMPTARPVQATPKPTAQKTATPKSADPGKLTPVPTAVPTPIPTATPISKQTFTISIEGPEGTILPKTKVQYNDGMKKTVADVTFDICRQSGITVVTSRKRFNKLFIESFNDTNNGIYGSASGWLYYVNNHVPMFGVEEYEISDGDVIEWKYTQ